MRDEVAYVQGLIGTHLPGDQGYVKVVKGGRLSRGSLTFKDCPSEHQDYVRTEVAEFSRKDIEFE